MRSNRCMPLLICLALVLGSAACASDVTIEIDSKNETPFHREAHGFNTNFTRGPYGVNNRQQKDYLKELNPGLVRFPGGWLSEYYHWRSGGYSETELKQEGQRGSRTWTDFKRLFNGKLSFDDFMRLADSAGFKPVIEVNLTTGSPEESAGWVRYAKEKGYRVDAWELGNELYGRKARETFPDVNDYIDAARRHASAMKAVDPDIRIAVVASPAGIRKVRKPSRYYTRWDQQMGKETFYDAYVVHPYPHLHDYLNVDLREMADYLLPYSDFVFSEGRAWYQHHYGARPVWLTEWNLLPIDTQVANTQLHALYCGDFLIQLYRASDWVEIAQFHVLSRHGMGFPVISPPQANEKRADRKPVRRACYFPLQLAGQLNKIAATGLAVSVSGQKRRRASIGFQGRSYSLLNVAAFRGRDGQYLLMLTNRGADPMSITVSVDNAQAAGAYELYIIGNDSLSASNGGNERMGISGSMDIAIEKRVGTGPDIKLDAYSISLLEYK